MLIKQVRIVAKLQLENHISNANNKLILEQSSFVFRVYQVQNSEPSTGIKIHFVRRLIPECCFLTSVCNGH